MPMPLDYLSMIKKLLNFHNLSFLNQNPKLPIVCREAMNGLWYALHFLLIMKKS